MNGIEYTMLVFSVLALLNLVASLISLYIFYRLLRLYVRIAEASLGLLATGFLVLFTSLFLSASYYVAASYQLWEMSSQMPPWMRGMHHNMGEQMARFMPMHWPIMADVLGLTPIPWFSLRILTIASYILILLGYITGRTRVDESVGGGEPDNQLGDAVRFILFLPAGPLIVGINTLSVIILVLILATVYTSYRRLNTTLLLGFTLLAFSHLIEMLSFRETSVYLMLTSDALKPLALFAIAVGVAYESKK